ncbi:hypothetical protein [Nonomuraea angiospora]|uniref:hypothetical protein n=1 Tax=Nonomuraea angiospora TaxID=46172 RepID=UPI0029B9A5B7|nr:hypothetical protein [Nonomuraea angiospora]MDX3103502.1 hypothetical protein [Nonomuraea angiospora]
MSITLADQDKLTLRIAGWDAVSLMSAAGAAGSAQDTSDTDRRTALNAPQRP